MRTLALLMAAVLSACGGEGAARPAAEKERVVLFVGDSLTDGHHLPRRHAYPALIQQKIDAKGWPLTVVNAAVSGATTADGRRRAEQFSERPLAVLVVALGVNDVFRQVPLAEIERNLQATIDFFRRRNPELRVVVVGVQVPLTWGRLYARELPRMYRTLAKRNDAVLIPDLLAGVAGEPEYHSSDGLHPSVEGHRIMAQTVWEYLEPVLARIAGPYRFGARPRLPGHARMGPLAR